ncbi:MULTISPECIES: FAD-dependent oxidoreductase [unclassified Rhodococcus (in: high G+C Gram-positive bacteria)]|uniref:FAD-dependent oxidoreductase n=1 Tax=unclassified Rhodococcus (in: high G+C Gram-positive bacteria) TaxID=192944 RepID=UPI001A0FBB64|nr:NAD(P)/FAD-dependent oxidoreductase [Rhodococcus sp. (in: high G+C Gram-positive bacteria)]MBF0663210.1 FAD-dependent monooxygenase [Rhodococcus sp. (in: high G+C Gram-positive bacteria)]
MQSADLKNLTIAIVGAGYAGAASAKALSLLGADVTVYEQATEIREVGAGIGLRPSSMQRFREWGTFDAIAAVSSPSDYFEILTATGQPIMKEDWPGMDDYEVKTHTHLIHRGDFIDALVSVLPDGMVKLGHKLETVEDRGDKTVLTFTNGTVVEADLVVGADGIKSVVRKQLFSDQQPVFSGEHAYRAVISADATHGLATDDNLRMYIGKGTKVYFLPLRHRNDVSFDVTALCPDSTWSPEATREDLLATLEGFDERIVQIAREIDMNTVNLRAVYDIDPVDTWHSDSAVLVGDAAHSMLHHQGQGANSAILDAGALADALRDADTVAAALADFQATRKPVTDELQRISRQGWTEDEVNDVFPGQKPASQQPAAH